MPSPPKPPERVVLGNGEREITKWRCPECGGLYDSSSMATARRRREDGRGNNKTTNHGCVSKPGRRREPRGEPEVESVSLVETWTFRKIAEVRR